MHKRTEEGIQKQMEWAEIRNYHGWDQKRYNIEPEDRVICDCGFVIDKHWRADNTEARRCIMCDY